MKAFFICERVEWTSMEQAKWSAIAEDLEEEIRLLKGSRMKAQDLLARAEKALSDAEAESASKEVINRLDHLLIATTQAARDNVCTNTKCPHYNKKCKMR